MPDGYGFDHLPSWGIVTHRCIEEGCDFPTPPRSVRELERRRHHEKHVRDRARELDRLRRANLSHARRLQAQAERENELAYGDDRKGATR